MNLIIFGPPGAGKSSLMNKLIPLIRKENLSVGVIAIDPSSPITGGSFLGDRVRINNAVNDENVFVRSMGSRAELGGVTELAEDFSDILAFSGKDIIFIETVGVGQSEYSVSEITDRYPQDDVIGHDTNHKYHHDINLEIKFPIMDLKQIQTCKNL